MGGKTPGPYWPFEPLERILEARIADRRAPSCWAPDLRRRPAKTTQPLYRLAAMIDVTESTYLRYKARGIGAWAADRAATIIGIHPATIWPQYWDWIPTDADLARAERNRKKRSADRARAHRERAGVL